MKKCVVEGYVTTNLRGLEFVFAFDREKLYTKTWVAEKKIDETDKKIRITVEEVD